MFCTLYVTRSRSRFFIAYSRLKKRVQIIAKYSLIPLNTEWNKPLNAEWNLIKRGFLVQWMAASMVTEPIITKNLYITLSKIWESIERRQYINIKVSIRVADEWEFLEKNLFINVQVILWVAVKKMIIKPIRKIREH